MTEGYAAAQSGEHDERNGLLRQIHRSGAGGVEVPIHANESCAGIDLAGGRIFRVRQAAVKMARHEEPLSLGIVVGKTASRLRHV
jgi:hypothetical protein